MCPTTSRRSSCGTFLHIDEFALCIQASHIYAGMLVCFRGAELFQATIVKAVRARLEEERKSVEQLKRQ